MNNIQDAITVELTYDAVIDRIAKDHQAVNFHTVTCYDSQRQVEQYLQFQIPYCNIGLYPKVYNIDILRHLLFSYVFLTPFRVTSLYVAAIPLPPLNASQLQELLVGGGTPNRDVFVPQAMGVYWMFWSHN